MSWVDIGIIGLVVLFGLIGVLRGAKKSLVSLGAFLIAFILAFFLANIVAEGLLGIGGIKKFVLGDGLPGTSSEWSLSSWIYNGMSSTEISTESFVHKKYLKPIMDIVNPQIDKLANGGVNISAPQGYAIYIAFLLFSTIVGAGIFLVARFLLIIVTVIIGSYIGKQKTALTRFLGFLVGFVQGGVLALAISIIFSNIGGLVFMPAINKIEKEYEYKNAVFCGYVYEAAYGMRDKMYLPSAEMFGRTVALVTQKKYEEQDSELPASRLNVFVNINNLNYKNQPWDIDSKTKKRTFDEENAELINPYTYECVGYDRIIKAIFDYNTQAAAVIDNREKLDELSSSDFDTLNSFVQTSSDSLYNYYNDLFTMLTNYVNKYKAEWESTDTERNLSTVNGALLSAHAAINSQLGKIAGVYAHIDNYLDIGFPVLDELMPESVQITGSEAGPFPGDSVRPYPAPPENVTPPEEQETPPEEQETSAE